MQALPPRGFHSNMLAVGAQQQQPVGLAWLLPALGTAASASCQFVCPQWGSALSTQAQPAFFGQDFLQLQPQVHGPGAPLPSRVLPNPGWLAGLPPLFAPPTQEQPGRTPPGDSIQQSHCERDSVDASFHLVTSDQSQQTGKLSPVAPTRRLLAYEDRAWSTESCDSLSEDSQGDLSDQEDLSESNLSSQGSQQTSSSALEALLAVADTCSNTGCLTPEEALQVARERYELACGRLQGMHSKARGDSPRSLAETGSAGGSSRASPRASRPGAFAGVSKLTAQQRRARHRCNNPWSIAETQALLEGIEQCGVGKWADIQRLRLAAIIKRSPVDLKDKWRNLSRLAQDPNTGRANNTVPRHFLLQVRRILGL